MGLFIMELFNIITIDNTHSYERRSVIILGHFIFILFKISQQIIMLLQV